MDNIGKLAAFQNMGSHEAASPRTVPDFFDKPYELKKPNLIPPREWIYGRHYIRKFISATVAPGGVGKSSLTIVEALAMVTGRALLGVAPVEQVNVALWNGEDPRDELDRRIAATAMHYRIEDLEGRLFVDTGREKKIVIGTQTRDGTKIAIPLVDALVKKIRDNKIGLLCVDPFVSSHRVSENDNGSIEEVVAAWADIADATGCAIELVHHSRKTGGAGVTVEDARGASALLAKARSARVLNPMSAAEAAKFGLAEGGHRSYFRVENGKANLAKPAAKATWYHLESVYLGNATERRPGDDVGVVEVWTPPDATEISMTDLHAIQTEISKGQWRASSSATDWVGKAIAKVLDLDVQQDEAKIKSLLKRWLSDGSLKIARVKNTAKGRVQPFVEVDNWAVLS